MAIGLNYKFDEEEKQALKNRFTVLLDSYNYKESEIILFNELDELGLRSEFYLDIVLEVKKEIKEEMEGVKWDGET